jgi:gliding motility-associated protein GldE
LDPDPALALTFLWNALSLEATTTFDVNVLVIELLLIFLGLVFSFLFSGSEVAFFSIKGAEYERLQQLAQQSGTHASILSMLDHPRRLLSTILIGNTFANIITSVVAAVLTGEIAHLFKLPDWLIYLIEIIVVTFTLVIVSEITPKVIAIKKPIEFAQRINWFIRTVYFLLFPVSNLIAKSAGYIENKLPKSVQDISSDDIRTLAEVGEEQGSLKEDEREIFENVIEFGQTTVKEIMTSRVDIVAVSVDDALGEVIELILTKKLSRMPLYGEDLDEIIGVIYAKDILPYLRTDLAGTSINWKTLARKVLFVPTTKRLDDLLKDFKKEKTHLAVVVDEWGGTEGIVTLDDVLEEIIGDIADETTEQEQLYSKIDENTYLFDAKINLEDVEEILEREDLSTPDDEYETLGGLVYHIMERIPIAGESIQHKGLDISVSSLENNRLKKIKVKVLPRD